MSSKDLHHFKPFLSVLLIILSLFVVVFLQMEERRLGYSLLKLNHEHKKVLELHRQREIQFAKMTRPQWLDQMAQSRLTLKKVQSNQIIHLSGASSVPVVVKGSL